MTALSTEVEVESLGTRSPVQENLNPGGARSTVVVLSLKNPAWAGSSDFLLAPVSSLHRGM